MSLPDSMIPPVPRQTAEWLTEHTGVKPTFTRKKRVLLMEHKNDRVRMTISFGFNLGLWVQSGSTLEVDGVRTVLASDAEEYVRVFKGEAEPTSDLWDDGIKDHEPPLPPPNTDYRQTVAVQSGPRHNR